MQPMESMHKIRPFAAQIHPGVDRNDPQAAITAVELQFPNTFSHKAWRVIRYFAGTMFLYVYKGRFVVTDESLELTEYGDGTHEAPYGGPRWIGDSLEELERWLEQIADEYNAADFEIPGRSPKPSERPRLPGWHEPSANVLVKLTKSNQCISVRTYCRKDGAHGRFLIYRATLISLLDAPVGKTSYEEDCGNFVMIRRLADSLRLSFAWLSTYGNGTVKGIRQDLTIPLYLIEKILHQEEYVKYLYIPPTFYTTINARPAAAAIHEIVKDRQIRRAFSKAMRDCFHWPNDEITLYRDGQHSFFFTTKSGCPQNGGLILHRSTRNGHCCVYYSVHT